MLTHLVEPTAGEHTRESLTDGRWEVARVVSERSPTVLLARLEGVELAVLRMAPLTVLPTAPLTTPLTTPRLCDHFPLHPPRTHKPHRRTK